jgi:hypothetical protein
VAVGAEKATLKDARTEIVALYIYEIACDALEVVIRRLVDRELERLKAHPRDCRCSAPCALSRGVSPSRVYWTAHVWQNSSTVKNVVGRSRAADRTRDPVPRSSPLRATASFSSRPSRESRR